MNRHDKELNQGDPFRFRFRRIFDDDEFQPYAEWIQALNQQLITQTLANIDTGNCELTVDLRVYFPEHALNVSFL